MGGRARETFVTELVTDADKGIVEVNRYEQAMGKATARADKLKAANDKLSTATDRTGDAAKRASAPLRMQQKATEDAEKALTRLVRVQNPAALTAKRLADAENLVSAARRRGVKITGDHLRAIDNLRAKYERQTRAANDNTRAANDNARAVTRMGGSFGKLQTAILAVQGLLAGALIARAVREMISGFAGFEAKLSEVKAVTQATAGDMMLLEKQARMLGATTQFSAKQAADGMAFLGRAGFKTNQIMAAMPGTLQLAAAGALDLGDAADIASNVLTGFGLLASDMDRVSDVLAKTAASANTSVLQLGAAMKFVAPVAATLGVSIEEAAAGIGKLSDAGLQGEMAGTGLRMALVSLVNPNDKAKEAIKSLGLNLEDVNPKTNKLADVLAKLAEKGLGVEQAMTIAGARGGTALLAMTRQAAGVQDLTASLKDAEGAAKAMALTMQDNLSGEGRRLVSVMSEVGLMLVGDSGMGGALRTLTSNIANTLLVWTQFSNLLGADEARFTAIARSIEAAGASLGTYLAILAAIRVGTMAWAAATTIATGGLNLIIPAIAAGVGSIVLFRDEMLSFGSVVTETADGVSVFSENVVSIGDIVSGVFSVLSDRAIKAVEAIVAAFDKMAGDLPLIGGSIGDAYLTMFRAIGTFAVSAGNNIINAFRAAWTFVSEAVTGIVNAVRNIAGKTALVFDGLWEAIKGGGTESLRRALATKMETSITGALSEATKKAAANFDDRPLQSIGEAFVLHFSDLGSEIAEAAGSSRYMRELERLGEEEQKAIEGAIGLAGALKVLPKAADPAATATGGVADKAKSVATSLTALIGQLDPVAGHYAQMGKQAALLNTALDKGLITLDEHGDLVDRLIQKDEAWEVARQQAIGSVGLEADKMFAQNEIAALNLQLRGANAEATLDLTNKIIEHEKALSLSNIEMRRQKDLLGKLPDEIKTINGNYDRLKAATEETFDARQVQAFVDANRQAAREFEDDWSSSISYVQGLFGGWIDGLLDKLGPLGSALKSIGGDILGQLLPKGSDGRPLSVGSLIGGGIRSIFSEDGPTSGGGFDITKLSFISDAKKIFDFGKKAYGFFTGGASAPLSTAGVAGNVGGFGGIGPGLSGVSAGGFGPASTAGTIAEFGGVAAPSAAAPSAASVAASMGGGPQTAAAAAGGALNAGAMPLMLGIGAAAAVIIPGIVAIMKNAAPKPAFGTRFGADESGLLQTLALATDDGFDDGLAKQISDGFRDTTNAFLQASGLRLGAGAFQGELAFNNGQFASSGAFANNAVNERLDDQTGILGLNYDSRRFAQAETAIADHFYRSMFLALENGQIEGITRANEDIYRVGLGNGIRQVRDRVVGPDAGANFAHDIDFLSQFAAARESFNEVALAADDAAGRLLAAADSQGVYAKALDEVRATAKATAAENGSPLAAISTWMEDARRIFDPTGGAAVQARLRLDDTREGVGFYRQGGLNGGLDVRNATIVGGLFDDGGYSAIDKDFSPATGAVQNLIDGPNGGGGYKSLEASALAGGIQFGSVTLRPQSVDFESPSAGSFFIENGRGATFGDGTGNNVQLDGMGQGNTTGLSVDADAFVKAVVGAGVTFADVINDPFATAGAGLILESAVLGQAKIQEFFDGISGDATTALAGPLALFEELTPAVSPLVTQMIEMQEALEKTRPDIDKFNAGLAELGITAKTADQYINEANAAILGAGRENLLAQLGRRIDSETGEVQTGIDFNAINTLANTIKGIDQTLSTVYEGYDPATAAAEVVAMYDATTGGINDQLLAGIQAILSGAQDGGATFAAIKDVFGARLDGLDIATPLQDAGTGLEAFSEGLTAATATIDEQMRVQEQAIDRMSGAVNSIRGARNAANQNDNLSILTPMERLAEAKRLFDQGLADAKGDSPAALDAAANLGSLRNSYLEIARTVHASSDAYVEIFKSTDTSMDLVAKRIETELSVARSQLSVLEEIRDGMAANDNSPSDGQYPARNSILRSLTGFTGDFGEGRFGAHLNAINANDALRAQVSNIAGLIPFADGGIMTSHGSLPLNRYSRGGIANSPQLALFGEGRGPEAYIPLPDSRGVPVVLHMPTPPSSSGTDHRLLEALDRLERALREEHAADRGTAAEGAIHVGNLVEEGNEETRRLVSEAARQAAKEAA